MKEKLILPCPFCGSEPEVMGSGDGQKGLMIHCIGKGCPNPSVSYYDHDAARAVWNRRLAHPPQASWQPIETAKHDATEIWLGAEGRSILGYFSRDKWRSSWTTDPLRWEPTHWRPFEQPAAPAVTRPHGAGE